eukprot:2220275-Amphidinium_carterae.1
MENVNDKQHRSTTTPSSTTSLTSRTHQRCITESEAKKRRKTRNELTSGDEAVPPFQKYQRKRGGRSTATRGPFTTISECCSTLSTKQQRENHTGLYETAID